MSIPSDEEIKQLADLLWFATDEDGEAILESSQTRTRRGFAVDLALYLLRAGVDVKAARPLHIGVVG